MFLSDISIVVRKMRTFAEKSLSEYDLGFPEQLVLMHLTAHGTSNQESIAASLDIDKGAITKTIAKLEAKGYVVRELNPNNRREKIVALTNNAQPAINALKQSFDSLQETIFKGLSAEEIAQTSSGLARIAANLSEEIATQKEH